ncbi:MAG: hypothetical protein R3F29_05210 [Planctomycetota bacterium]
MLEDDLRKDGADVRTVNCGAAGAVCIDEYVVGLEQRFVAVPARRGGADDLPTT